jgi:hypothetical protein
MMLLIIEATLASAEVSAGAVAKADQNGCKLSLADDYFAGYLQQGAKKTVAYDAIINLAGAKLGSALA